MIHLDTTFLVDFLRELDRGETGPAHLFLRDLEDEQLGISVHVVCELYCGAALARRGKQERERIEHLCESLQVIFPDQRFGPAYGALFASLERRGERIGTMDLLIATAAVLDQAPLATRDRKDFARVPALKLLAY